MKRYYYKGKEISKFHADMIFIGAIAGLFASAIGVYACLWCVLAIGNLIG